MFRFYSKIFIKLVRFQNVKFIFHISDQRFFNNLWYLYILIYFFYLARFFVRKIYLSDIRGGQALALSTHVLFVNSEVVLLYCTLRLYLFPLGVTELLFVFKISLRHHLAH